MTGEHDVGVERLEAGERLQVLDQAAAAKEVALVVELDERVRGDGRQQMIA